MRLSSKSTQEAFVRSPWLRVGSLAGVSLLIVVSLLGVWKAFSLPTKTEQPTTVANYAHTGEFDYLVYLKPNSLYGPMPSEEEKEAEQEAPAVFFRNIIDEAELAFSYNFSCSQSLSSITNKVVVSAIAENPGMWQKEITILEETHEGGEFRVDFSLLLLLNSLESMVNDIEQEIGIWGGGTSFVIKAAVNTEAHTAMGTTIEEYFNHSITAVVATYTLKLNGSLGRSDTGSKEGVGYTEQGWFDYEIYLKPNKLYEEDVLRSEGFPVAEPSSSSPPPTQSVGPGLVYFRSIIDHITASFSYRFDCDEPVRNLVEEVEVMAILEDPGTWSKTLTIVPKTRKSGAFVVGFPVDLSQFTGVAGALGNELNINTLPCPLTIKAEVHTTADTDSGHIDEVFTHSLATTLGGPTLSFTGGLSRSQPGTIVESRMAPVAKAWVFRVLSLAGLALAAFGFLFVVKNSRQAKALPISRMEEEALRAKKKHKGVIVDVSELPPTGAGEVVIPIGSVDEVVRTADALLKPVLHHAEADKHTYCVIDGAIRYQYIVET